MRSLDRYTERVALCSLDHCIAGVALRSLGRYTERAALRSSDHCIAAVASPLFDRSVLQKPGFRFVAARSILAEGKTSRQDQGEMKVA
jgi:hypothetical protein